MKINIAVVSFIITLFYSGEIYPQRIQSLDDFRSNPYYEVKIDADSIVEIYNKKTNLRWLKSIKSYSEPENARTADLIIELDTLNLSYWENLYRQWGWLDAANPILDAKFIVTDANKNGMNEIYAIQATDTLPDLQFSSVIFENLYDSLFAYVKTIDIDVAPVYDISDITGDGLLDIISPTYGAALRFYKQNNDTDYISNFNFVYDRFTPYNQANDVTFYDLDNDGIQEIIYYLAAGGDTIWSYCNHVARYNPSINNYELIYYHRPAPHFFTFGFAIGDLDNDGKNNFSTGSIDGNYFVYEYVAGNNIQLEYQAHLETLNAFLSVMSEDMNGNGKNEIWVGSDFASSQYGGVTRVFVLEDAGNGTYQVVYQIDIRGLFSGLYGRIRYVDVDGDGTKEIFLNNGSLVFCFKYSPQKNFYLDFIIDTWDYSQDSYEGTDAADLDSDGICEFIMQKFINYLPYAYKSLFWKRDKVSDVVGGNNFLPEEFNLYQNYPNPFNPSTTIKFSLPQEAKVNIKIYNVVGKEITQLVNETRLSGEYEITWDGRDSNGNQMPSGIYFITMFANPGLSGKAGSFQKTIKSVLIK